MMARKASRPGRTLVVFVLVVLAMYGGLAIANVWKPKLGLDLEGGTRITLSGQQPDGSDPTTTELDEAAGIIDNRVNATGVSEAEVSTQGNNNIVVEIPGSGKQNQQLVDAVQQTAQLRFRLVAGQPAMGQPQLQISPGPTATSSGEPTGKGDGKADKKTGKEKPSPAPTATLKPSATPKGRAVSEGLIRADQVRAAKPKPTPTAKATGKNGKATPDAKPSAQTSDQPNPVVTQAPTPSSKVPTDESSVQELLAWTKNPDAESLQRFQNFTCDKADQVEDDPSKPIVACDDDGVKYLLSPAIIEGTELDSAGFGIPQNDVNYVVTLDFNGDASKTFGNVTTALAGTGQQFAIVLDGVVLSAPTVENPITDGNAQISGNFTQESAQSLANSLKYGALPLKFEVLDVTFEGPTLAGNQLSAGLLAGAVGLALVLVYCMLYYRGLGVVVVASLAAAAAVTYAAVLFLSQNAGFTLTLPGIAGLIVAVGITADSFIVYFERIRDEMRAGRSVRVAVEAGWDRAKMTCVAADAVSLLAAVVLYIFAIGVVKGFAFALGISTVIDLVVFFFFTKPLVTWLARFRFFSTGHKLSGLSPDHAGIERIGVPAGTTGRIAR